MKRWAIYARYSSDRQNPKSCDDQIFECEKRIATLEGVTTHRYSDEAVSGAHEAKRPRYAAMLAAMKAGAFDAVIAEDTDRFNRNLEASARLYSLSVRDEVEIWTLADGRISQMHTGFKGLMSELFLAQLADKTRRGMLAVAREGRYASGLCYGYSIAGLGLRTPHTGQSAIVQRIYNEYASGVAPVKICGTLNREGIAPPRGAEWRVSTLVGNLKRLNGILSNPIYIGKPVFNRQRFVKDPETGKRQAKPNPPDQWVHQDSPHLRIVSDELWSTVQARRENRGGTHAVHLMRRPKTLLSGLVRCEECGSPMALNGAYFRCTAHGNAGTCGMSRGVRSAALEGWIIDGLRGALDDSGLVAAYVRRIHETAARLDAEAGARAEGAAQKGREIDRKIVNLIAAVEDGRANELIMSRLATLQAEKQTQAGNLIERERPQTLRIIPDARARFRRQLSELSGKLAGESANATQSREIVRSMIARIGAKRAEKGIWIEVDADLGAILSYVDRPESCLQMVAGARNTLYPKVILPIVRRAA